VGTDLTTPRTAAERQRDNWRGPQSGEAAVYARPRPEGCEAVAGGLLTSVVRCTVSFESICPIGDYSGIFSTNGFRTPDRPCACSECHEHNLLINNALVS